MPDDGNALVHDDERMRIVLQDDMFEPGDFVLGNQDVEDIGAFVGVGAHAVQARDAAVQLPQDLLLQLPVVQLRDDPDFHVDVLGMGAVDGHAADSRVDQGIDHGADVEQKQADPVQDHVGNHIDPADAEVLLPFDQQHPHNIHAAQGPAHAQRGAHAVSADQGTDDAARQHVVRQQRLLRDRDHGEEYRGGRDADHGLGQELLAQVPHGQNQNRNVHRVIDQAGDVEILQRQVQIADQDGTDHLREAHHPAAVKPGRHDEEVHPRRIDRRPEQGDQKPPAFFPHFLLFKMFR